MISKLWYKLSVCLRLVQTSVYERAQLVTVKYFA